MRGKRSKQYRKLMEQYQSSWGFRPPYQVLVDAEIVRDCSRWKLDLISGLKRTLHTRDIKPMITQCSMRHLYAWKAETGMDAIIEQAKDILERRFCGHHPNEYPEPLTTEACFASVLDPKETGRNKHHYIVASQAQSVRRRMRGVTGVPLIYVDRGVMIMEPMADRSVQDRTRAERSKFRADLKDTRKRKREGEGEGEGGEEEEGGLGGETGGVVDTHGGTRAKEKKKKYGVKGPNPLSVLKPKKRKKLEV